MSFHPGRSPHLLLLVSLAVGCAAPKDPAVVDDTAPGTTATGGRPEGEDVTVTVFDEEYIYYGDENRRTVDIAVTFPDDAFTYASLTGASSAWTARRTRATGGTATAPSAS